MNPVMIVTTPPILLVLMGMALVLMVLFAAISLIYQRKLALAAASLAVTCHRCLIDHDDRIIDLEACISERMESDYATMPGEDFDDEEDDEDEAVHEAAFALSQRAAYLSVVPMSDTERIEASDVQA